MIKKIIILGAGVGGLTVAHELANAKNAKYEIHIFEKNPTIGGMARSGYKKRNNTLLPTEYCWRIYGPNYENLRNTLKQIPLKDNPSKSVHDNLIDIYDYLIADQNTVLRMNNRPSTLLQIRKAFEKVPPEEKKHVLKKIWYGFMISTRRLNQLDNLTWEEYIDPDNSLHRDMKKYVVDILGPYLGAEPRKVNVPSVIKTFESFKLLNGPISVMNAPTNEAWFDHWKFYLESKGVIFHLETDVKDIHPEGDLIKEVELVDGTRVKGDEYFCSLSVDSVASMPSLNLPGMKKLAKHSYQLMVGIQLFFDKKITLPHDRTALYIPDSPWQLVIEPQGSIWGKSYSDVGDIWSIGLCDPVRPGLLIKKPFIECSHEEICDEVWHQIRNSELNNFLNLNNYQVVDFNVWDTYVFDGKKIKTCEPKFSTNKDTFFLRPENKTAYKNFFFATGYTQTDTDMFEMESAAESGKRAAHLLDNSVKYIGFDRLLFFSFYQWLDSLFHERDIYKKRPFLFFYLGIPFAIILFPFVYLKYLFQRYGNIR